MIGKFLLRLAAKKAAKRLRRSATAAVAGGVGAAGVASVINPELIETIPEQHRGWALLGIGVLVVLARVRKEIGEAIAEAKASGAEDG